MIIIILNCSSTARMIGTLCDLLRLGFINFLVHFMLTFSNDSYFKIFLIDNEALNMLLKHFIFRFNLSFL